MMHTIGHGIFWILFVALIPILGNAQLISPNINNSILNKNLDRVINTDLATDPLRDGAFVIINDGNNSNSVDNIIGNTTATKIGTFGNAKNRIINILNTLVNYSLGILAFVALIYLMYHGLLVLTAAGEEERYNTGIQGVKYAAIALIGIGLSWFIVSLIFYIIDFIIS